MAAVLDSGAAPPQMRKGRGQPAALRQFRFRPAFTLAWNLFPDRRRRRREVLPALSLASPPHTPKVEDCTLNWGRLAGLWRGGKTTSPQAGIWGQAPNQGSLQCVRKAGLAAPPAPRRPVWALTCAWWRLLGAGMRAGGFERSP